MNITGYKQKDLEVVRYFYEHYDVKLKNGNIILLIEENRFPEDFLREIWKYVYNCQTIQTNYHLSMDFLREVHDDIIWSYIIKYNPHYTLAEKERFIKEFDLVCEERYHILGTNFVWYERNSKWRL